MGRPARLRFGGIGSVGYHGWYLDRDSFQQEPQVSRPWARHRHIEPLRKSRSAMHHYSEQPAIGWHLTLEAAKPRLR